MIMPLVVLDSTDSASYSNMASAITYAADHGARIINMSLGSTYNSSALLSATDYAWSKNAVVFAAAGNNGNSTPFYPASNPNVVAVSATNSSNVRASWSNYGTWIDLSAPGDTIMTTNKGGGYGYWSGTSFASPIAAAVAALVLSVKPSLSNSALVSLLENNADDLGTAGYDEYYGWGRVDAYKAVLAAKNMTGDTTPPSVSITSPAAGATVSGIINVQGMATDNVGVTEVQFYIGTQLVASSASGPFAFPWTTTSSANGSVTLTIKAYDAANNVGEASVTVSVNNAVVTDTTPPTVAITSPANGVKVSASTKINVAASDNVAVVQVCIYIDGTKVYTGTTAPYTYSWNTKKVKTGAHTITASAWDHAGNMGSAAPITVYK
jgi:thermitase